MLMTNGFSNIARWLRSRVVIAVGITLFLGVVFFHGASNYQPHSSAGAEGSLHLLVPATSSNVDLCRLLLSTAVLNYPIPVLINWGAAEAKDAYVQHLAKVWTILAYLDLLHNSGKGNDLVLIVDGFDIHFQLPPEVLIHRYYQENARANERILAQVGPVNMALHGFKQTVIFGHDKLCWPMDNRRPACWAVPDASDPPHAYGPYTDYDPQKARARWLNSGTVMGPVTDVRDVFKATLDLIHANHTTDSDQFYFANVFAKQEYAKNLLGNDPFKGKTKDNADFLDIAEGERTDYYIGLDYEAVLFQTMAFFRPFITWMTFSSPSKTKSYFPGLKGVPQNALSHDPYYDKHLPADLENARGPFHAALEIQKHPQAKKQQGISTTPGQTSLPTHKTWSDFRLGINVISNQIFPMLHFTGPKEFRALWWPRLWFVPYSEELLKASTAMMKMDRQPIVKKPIGGTVWWNAEMEGQRKVDLGSKGGVFSDNGTFLGWEGLCGAHEPIIFGRVEGKRI